MQGPFRENDIVGVTHLGRDFLAIVTDEQTKAELTVKPLAKNVTYYHIPKRDVTAIWRFARGRKPYVKRSGGVTF
jgi:hypothetical protein